MEADAVTSKLVRAQRAHFIQSSETLQSKALLFFNSLSGCRESTNTGMINSNAKSKQKLCSQWNVWVCQALEKHAMQLNQTTFTKAKDLSFFPEKNIWLHHLFDQLLLPCCRNNMCLFMTPSWRHVYVGIQPYQCVSSEPFTTTLADWTHRPIPARLKMSSR